MAIKDFKYSELNAKRLAVGDQFPDFKFYDNTFEKNELAFFKNDTKIIMIIPSLSTGLCDAQMHELCQKLNTHHGVVLVISHDSPIVAANWCTLKANKNTRVFSFSGSGLKGQEFEKAIGVYIPECEFLAYRSVFVLDINNKIIYCEYAPSLKTGLDLKKLIAFVQK